MSDETLYGTKRDLKISAKRLPVIEKNGKLTNKYEDYSIDDLANNYCKATDEHNARNRDIYMSALLLRFWYMIDKMFFKVRGTDFDRVDVFNRIYDCIEAACKYRAWQDPSKNTNAQACINQVLAGRGVPAMLYEYNQKHHMKNTESLDIQIDDETSATSGDMIADQSDLDSVEEIESTNNAVDFIKTLVSENKLLEAVIADNMAFKDVYKYSSSTVKVENSDGEDISYKQNEAEFWPFKLVKELNSLNDEYYQYFSETYRVSPSKLDVVKKTIEQANNQKKYKFISSTQATLKNYAYMLMN